MPVGTSRAVPVAPGYPQYAGVWTPEVWAADTLKHFYDASVIPAISNTRYEGQIKNQGDRVIIRIAPDVEWRDYAKGQSIEYDAMEPANTELVIDKAKYWGVKIDDIDKVQSDIDWLSKFTQSSAESGKIVVDRDVLSTIYADVPADNAGATAGRVSHALNLGATGTPLALTKLNMIDILVDAGTILDEQNAPESGRWIVIPPILGGMIKKSELKDASLSGDGTSILRNGRIGIIDRFTVYYSNLLPSVLDGANTSYYIPFGTKDALTFAAQIPGKTVERLRSDKFFGTLVRGLMAYGFKILYPEMIGVIYGYKG